MFYVIICYTPVAIVIQCFIDASNFIFFTDYKPLFIVLIAVTTDNPMSQLFAIFSANYCI